MPASRTRLHALLLLALAAACATSSPDTRDPAIASLAPAPGTPGLRSSTDFVVTFTEAMDPATLEPAISLEDAGTGARVEATVTWNPAALTATIHPVRQLAAGRALLLRVTPAARDPAGNALAEGVAARYTLAVDDVAPSIARLWPRDLGVSTYRPVVEVLFDEPLAAGSAAGASLVLEDDAGRPVPGTFGHDAAAGRLTYATDGMVFLEKGRSYRATVRAIAADPAGNARPVERSWSFTPADPQVTGPITISPPSAAASDLITIRIPVNDAADWADFVIQLAGDAGAWKTNIGAISGREDGCLVGRLQLPHVGPGRYALLFELMDGSLRGRVPYAFFSPSAPLTYLVPSPPGGPLVDSGIPVATVDIGFPPRPANLSGNLSLDHQPALETNQLTYTVWNTGEVDAPPSAAGIFLDPPQPPDVFMLPDVWIDVPAVPAGQAFTRTIPVILPDRWRGDVFLVADLTGAIVEGSELDNVLVERYGPRVSQGVSPNLAIPDLGGWVSSSLTVEGAPTSLLKVSVQVQILHPSTQDLVLHVASPAGTSVRLADLDGFGANYDGTAFDDDAPVGLGAGEAPFQGAYRPIEPLAKVAGEDPNGIWTLSIRDARGEEVGVLTWWVLDLW